MNNWKKNVALFLSSQAISLFGSSVVSFAIVWFITRQTHSGLWVSLLTVSSYLPQFGVSFFAGVWADRYSRKILIIAADSMIAAFTCLLVLLIPRFTAPAAAGLVLSFMPLTAVLMIDIVTAVIGIGLFCFVSSPVREMAEDLQAFCVRCM